MIKKTFLKKMKNILVSQRKDLYSSVRKPEEIDLDGDEIDEIQGNMLIELSDRINSRLRDKLSKIESALQKIERNSYGLCDDCGEEISEKRLLLNPYFITCISCAEEREIFDKQRKRA
jgi:DnaK suppressor protein